ncbi:hypothetical protein C1631_021250 [Chryseobacterium phosphatilyticum]|uniref:Uncharacterized protein n=1 Tax=Chryseobacterium phosphatilyticum TaxID=475075 RepID=A0A316WV86_9FLAO|nr:hypothetical protein C1631_021250 [Chryseobacterium phosphatilyticum]
MQNFHKKIIIVKSKYPKINEAVFFLLRFALLHRYLDLYHKNLFETLRQFYSFKTNSLQS